ncbi:glycosyltransferase family 2 protein [Enterococcus gilvus]|uniref:glycosyltransferase family 2 protein n=1 Tax=Enterococcus gilvus TaxID=160453 RepID=UPI00345E6BC5
MKKCKLSIIIPVYNGLESIENCINSIIKQNYENLEIVVVDDGSTDKTNYLLEEKYSDDDRITIITKVNEGVSSARNMGLIRASGQYVMFVDSDDEIFSEVSLLKKMMRMIISENLDLLITGFLEKRDNERVINRKIVNNEINFYTNEDFISSLSTLQGNPNINTFVPWAKVYSLKIIKENKLLFPEMRIGEDALFNLFYYKIVKRVKISNIISYIYRTDNEKSAMNKSKIEDIHDKVLVAFEYFVFFDRKQSIYFSNYLLYTIQNSLKDYSNNLKKKRLLSVIDGIKQIEEFVSDVKYSEFSGFKNKVRLGTFKILLFLSDSIISKKT